MQYVGDPIDCIHTISGADNDLVDKYCWVEGTYTILKNIAKTPIVYLLFIILGTYTVKPEGDKILQGQSERTDHYW